MRKAKLTAEQTEQLKPYLKKLNTVERLTKEQERQLILEKCHGSREAADRLVTANLRLVIPTAIKYADKGLPIEDLVQEGNIGLMMAVEKFDYHKGKSLSFYASYWIRQQIQRAIATKAAVIRVPISAARELDEFRKQKEEIGEKLGQTASENMLAVKMNLPLKKVKELNFLAYEEVIPLDNETVETTEDTSFDMDEYIQERRIRECLGKALSMLSPLERTVLCMKIGFGLNRHDYYTEISKATGIPLSQLPSKFARACRKLRVMQPIEEIGEMIS